MTIEGNRVAIHIVEEAHRCLGCKKALCQLKGCPVLTPIPQVIDLFKQRRLEEAGELLFQNNPMSAVCSMVCNHSGQCEGACIQGRKGAPVHFSSIENYVSTAYLDRKEWKPAPSCGKQIAVVGSGPAGITVAIKMAQLGCAEFRLPRSLVQKYRHVMCSLGVRVRPSTTIGGALHIDDLLRDGYDAVFVGTGTWRARKLGIPGESRGNVLFGIDYLVDPTSVAIGQNVAVIGAGNVAMDVARTALRSGARKVTVYARSRHISAIDDEVELTELDGAEIVCGKAICAIDDNGPVFETAIFDEDNNVVGYEEELDHASADTVVIAASQVPKDKLVLTTGGLETDHRGLLSVDVHGMTTVPGVFAAGDVVNGPLTVVHAVAGAKLAVEGMTTYLGL